MSRIQWYNALEPRLLANSLTASGSMGASVKLRDACRLDLKDIYKCIIQYSIRSVLRFHSSRFKVFLQDVAKLDDWEVWLKDLREAEEQISTSIQQINQVDILDDLKSIQGNVKKTMKTLESHFGNLQQVQEAQLFALEESNRHAVKRVEISKQLLETSRDGNQFQKQHIKSEQEQKCM